MPGSTIHLVHLEADTVLADVTRAHAAAADAAEGVRHAAAAAFDAATTDAFGFDDAEALAERAGRLRAAALYALSQAVALVAQSGRLEQLASVRRTALCEDDDERG